MPAAGEVTLTSLLEAYLNANRDRKIQPKPFELAQPWQSQQATPSATPEERAALKSRLLRRSAFRGR